MAKDIRISSPLNGKLVPLNSINDPVFASGAMGRGVAVQNPKGQVFSPFDGEITVFFPEVRRRYRIADSRWHGYC